jgi:hypothetical protein
MVFLASDEAYFEKLVAAAKRDGARDEVASRDGDADKAAAYAGIDPVVQTWVDERRLVLQQEWQGPSRFWYTSRGKEAFQIYIDPPSNGRVHVHAWSIDTDDDAELHGDWEVSLDNLRSALAAATMLIDLWARRTRISAYGRLATLSSLQEPDVDLDEAGGLFTLEPWIIPRTT